MPALAVLGAMGLLVLAIACANIAGLVLVRGVSRRGEIAVRLALGATRARVVRLLILENLVLAVPGAILGVLLAWRGIPVIAAAAQNMALPQRLFFNIQIDAPVMAFSALVALRERAGVRIRAGDAQLADRSGHRHQRGFVAARRGARAAARRPGGRASRGVAAAADRRRAGDAQPRRGAPRLSRLRSRQVTSTEVDVRANGYDEARGRVFYRQLIDALRAEPGIDAVSLASVVPLNLLGTPRAAGRD